MLDTQRFLGNGFSLIYQYLDAIRYRIGKLESRLHRANATNVVKDSAKIERKGDAARALFQKWIDEEEDQEHKQTFEYLTEALDQDRLSNRKLFCVV